MLELTKARIIEVELSSSTNNAAHSVLSQFDPVLFHEYGLLAGEEGNHIDEIIQSSLDISFFPSQYPKNEYVVDYLLFNKNREKASTFMEPKAFSYDIEYAPFLEADYAYAKEQILEYMGPRQFYLLAEPFLEKLNLLSETSKSSEIIEEKSDLVSELEMFNSYTERLMLYFDGVAIGSGGKSYIKYDEPYIRKLSVDTISYDFFPKSYHEKYRQNTIFVEDVLENAITGIEKSDTLLKKIVKKDIKAEDIKRGYMGEIIKDKKLLDLVDRLAEIEEQYLEPSHEALEEIQAIKQTHEKSLAIIRMYSSMSQATLGKIERFQNRIDNEEQVISGLVKSINQELDDLKTEVDVHSENLEEVNNLKLFEERLTKNLEILSSCEQDIERLIDYTDDYAARKYNQLKKEKQLSSTTEDYLDMHMYSEFYKNRSTLDTMQIDGVARNVLENIQGYTTDLFFDYQNMDIQADREQEKKYKDKVEALSAIDLFETVSIQGVEAINPYLTIDQTLLPSNAIESETDQNGTFDAKEIFKTLSDPLLLAKNTHEKILLNEYIVGMFSSVVSQVDPNAKSLSGFALDDHLLEYEVEYILGGHFNERKNLEFVLAILFGVRVLCNTVHLAIDSAKRETILSIANAIAGWWTGGVGGAILAVVIGLCWAMVEAIVDVFMLTSGEKVPFIKTASTWYSSLDGNWEELFDASVRYVQNKALMYIKDTGELTKGAVSAVKNILDDAVEQNVGGNGFDRRRVEETMESVFTSVAEEMNIQIDVANRAIDNEIEEQLDSYLIQATQETEGNEDNQNQEELDPDVLSLIGAMKSTVDSQGLDSSSSLSEKVAVRETILNTYAGQIQQLKEATAQKQKEIYENASNYATEELKDYIDDKVKEGCDITTDLLTKKADEIKKDMKKNITEESKKKFGVENLIPSLDYTDYLRLFLFCSLQEEEVKMARVMDLIQMNIQKKYNDYDRSFENYFNGINITTTLKVPVTQQMPVHERIKNKLWEYQIEESARY